MCFYSVCWLARAMFEKEVSQKLNCALRVIVRRDWRSRAGLIGGASIFLQTLQTNFRSRSLFFSPEISSQKHKGCRCELAIKDSVYMV